MPTTSSLQVPEFRVSYAIETDKLDELYRKLKPQGVTMTALLAKACGVALASHPVLFSCVTPDGAGVTYNENINVALAVAMPDGGLITPVIKVCVGDGGACARTKVGSWAGCA